MNVQADLNLHCAHMYEGTFSDIVAQLCTCLIFITTSITFIILIVNLMKLNFYKVHKKENDLFIFKIWHSHSLIWAVWSGSSSPTYRICGFYRIYRLLMHVQASCSPIRAFIAHCPSQRSNVQISHSVCIFQSVYNIVSYFWWCMVPKFVFFIEHV